MNKDKITRIIVKTSITLFALIGSIALIINYSNLQAYASEAGGYSDWQGWIWPALLDVALLMSVLIVLSAQVNEWDRRVKWYAGIMIIIFSAGTVASNIAHIGLDNLNRLFVHTLPAAVLILSAELLRVTLGAIVKAPTIASAEKIKSKPATHTPSTESVEKAKSEPVKSKGLTAQQKKVKKFQNRKHIAHNMHAQGKTAKDIASKLGVSQQTVRKYLRETEVNNDSPE